MGIKTQHGEEDGGSSSPCCTPRGEGCGGCERKEGRVLDESGSNTSTLQNVLDQTNGSPQLSLCHGSLFARLTENNNYSLLCTQSFETQKTMAVATRGEACAPVFHQNCQLESTCNVPWQLRRCTQFFMQLHRYGSYDVMCTHAIFLFKLINIAFLQNFQNLLVANYTTQGV